MLIVMFCSAHFRYDSLEETKIMCEEKEGRATSGL